MAVVGILAAAGGGERLGRPGPKAFVGCGGRRLLDWSLDTLRAECERVVVAVPPGYEDEDDFVAGECSRSASVRVALRAAPEATVAVVHDAARPLVTPELVRACRDALEDGWEATVAAAPMSDTVKEASPEGRVLRTLDRTGLWRIQTPQAFRAEALRQALDVADEALAAATDDASLIEAAGGSVRVVEAPTENLKITTAADLDMAEAFLRRRRVPVGST